HLGHHRCSERLRRRTKQFLHRSPAAGCRRSRVFSRHHVFPRCLVSGAVPRPRVGVVPGCDSGIIGTWRSDVRAIVADGRTGGPGRGAMDVHRRGPARQHHRLCHSCEALRHAVWPAVTDVRVLILTAIQFAYTLGSYGIGIWLPQILKTHGLSNLAVGYVSAVPYLFASVAMLLWAAYVDRFGRKIL